MIIDNGSTDGTPEAARMLNKRVTVVESGANLGFAGACHAGARATRSPLLLFLNPDCQPKSGCLLALREAAMRHAAWGEWQPAVLEPDGRISSGGGVVHYLGLGWGGDSGRPVAVLSSAREVPFPSGAAMVVRRHVWDELGGLDPKYFMYGEDLDFGMRLWLAGHRVGVVPSARVIHNHEFEKGPDKWYWLERNRWRTAISVYPMPLLISLAPALLAGEVGLLAVAARRGWLRPKLRAVTAGIGDLPGTIARRCVIQRTRRISSGEFTFHLTSSLDSPFLGVPSQVNSLQAAYWMAIRIMVALLSRVRSRASLRPRRHYASLAELSDGRKPVEARETRRSRRS